MAWFAEWLEKITPCIHRPPPYFLLQKRQKRTPKSNFYRHHALPFRRGGAEHSTLEGHCGPFKCPQKGGGVEQQRSVQGCRGCRRFGDGGDSRRGNDDGYGERRKRCKRNCNGDG